MQKLSMNVAYVACGISLLSNQKYLEPPTPKHMHTYSVLSAQTANDSTTSRPSATDIPKSPPKWPLRPGVLVHVRGDTKQTLCTNRAQSPFNTSHNTSSWKNVSYASPLLSTTSRNTSACETAVGQTKINIGPDLPARNTKPAIPNAACNTSTTIINMKRIATKPMVRALLTDDGQPTNTTEMAQSDNGNIASTEATNNDINDNNNDDNNNNNNNSNNNNGVNDELLRFTTSNVIVRILGRLRWRRKQSSNAASNGANDNRDGGILSRSNRRAISLLRATGLFGSGKSTTSTTGLVTETKKLNNNGTTGNGSGKYLYNISYNQTKRPFYHTHIIGGVK